MRPERRSLGLVAAVLLAASGCRLDTAVLQKGGVQRYGVLLNYSCGAHVCDPIDPCKPTIVLTHGWNPAPKMIRCTFGPSSAAALRRRCGAGVNILSWDWNGVRVSALNDEPLRIGREQGRMLAGALRRRGVVPGRTQLVGHSLGTVVVAQAAHCLADLGPFRQATLLDPPTDFHEEIFDCQQLACHARCVENYWADRVSGYGGPVNRPGVHDYLVPDAPRPVLGIVDLSRSNHVHVMEWYYCTIASPEVPGGFQRSCLAGCCGCHACRAELAIAENGGVAPAAEVPVVQHDLESVDADAAEELALAPPQVASASAGSRKR